MVIYETESSRWQAVQRRDQAASSSFVYAVVSTKIYCRPGCPSRLARRANVCFYDTTENAIRDGYRPCLRCKPDHPSFNLNSQQAQQDIVERACSFIAETRGDVKFADIAKKVGLSTRYLYSLFKSIKGTTPAKFAATLRSNHNTQESSVTSSTATGTISPVVGESAETIPDTFNWSALLNFNYADFATSHESTDWPLQCKYNDSGTLVAKDMYSEREAVNIMLPDLDFMDSVLDFDDV